MRITDRIRMALKFRGQSAILDDVGVEHPTENKYEFYLQSSYENLEVVRRSVDLAVNSAIEVDINIGSSLPVKPVHPGAKKKLKSLTTVLNFRPNPFESVLEYRAELYLDLLLYGNCFQYFDGRDLFHLPARKMSVIADSKNKISHYEMDGSSGPIRYEINEIVHTRDNSISSIYKGKSRLESCVDSIDRLRKMHSFQTQFFENGAIPGLIITTPNVFTEKTKQKIIAAWQRYYSPKSGAKRPMILDGDMKLNPLSQINFKELEFEASIEKNELKILKAIGVPPILLDSGNNANIRPNIQLFYETTVIPLVNKIISSYERFFGYDLEPDIAKIRALRPELRDAGQYFTGLVNGGIMTINEARKELRLEDSTEAHADKLRIPANIAGSAADPSEGGRPPEEDDTENDDNETNSSEE